MVCGETIRIYAKKKSLRHPKADENARIEFAEKIKRYESEGKEIVYTDESGLAYEMARSYGYSKKGTRCTDIFNWGAKGRTNAIGALLHGILITVYLFQFNIDANTFYTWVVKDLLPKVPKGCVIVMDNASFHKRDDIRDAIEKAGNILEFLPPYSPDLNPIEHKWAQLKSIRRKKRCSVDEIFTI